MSAKDLLKQNNWIMLNKTLVHNLGLNAAVLIGELCDKEDYFEKDGEWFYVSRDIITKDVGLSSDAQRKASDILIDVGILSVELKGLPARNYYKIDDDKLLYWLTTSDAESQQQAVEISTTSHIESQQQAEEISTPYKEQSIKTKEKEQNIKAPEPVLSTYNSRRNFRKSYEPLTDKLNSGEIIDKEEKKKKRTPAEKLRDNGLAEIDSRNFDSATKDILRTYFEWASTGKDVRRIKSIDLWRSKLDALEQIVKKTGQSAEKIVQQSINNSWYKFEELQEIKSKTQAQKHEPLADKVGHRSAEEAQAELDALRADPNRKHY